MNNQNSLFLVGKNEAAAEFSDCRAYRYTLRRRWLDGNNIVQFIGLNPSTADETTDDNTIRVCRNFAQRWGYDAMVMTNLFAFRATDPRVMKRTENPVGPENDKYILEISQTAQMIVAVWGIHGTHIERNREVLNLLGDRLFCIGKSADGHPWHPLYKPGNLKPVPFIQSIRMEKR